MSITAAILQSYYGSATILHSYILNLLDPDSHCTLEQDSDPQPYKDLLHLSYVTCDAPATWSPHSRFKPYPPLVGMNEVIDRAQEKLFRMSKGKKPANMLTAGYRMSSRNGERGRADGGRMAITNHFVNTIVTALQGPEWETLLQRIGDGAMFHLLTEAAVFIALPNDCLCQVTGQPLVLKKVPPSWLIPTSLEQQSRTSRKRHQLTSHPDQRPSKRLRSLNLDENCSARPKEDPASKVTFDSTRTPADISFVRVRMFYSKPQYVPHSTSITFGLPPNHILNQIAPIYTRIQKNAHVRKALEYPRKLIDDARHLAKYVLPRQYGMSSAFACVGHKSYRPQIPDFTNRKMEIKMRGSMKTPKRVKPVLPLFEQIIWKHMKCRYKSLCDAVCPSKVSKSQSDTVNTTTILELMSEHACQPLSQLSRFDKSVSLDTSDRSMISRGLSQARKGAKLKPRFAEFVCSQLEVYRYAMLVTEAVIPHAFWGSQKNFRVISHYVKEFVCCRRYESVTLHHIQQGFSLSDCDWLMPDGQQSRVSVSDDLKRRELLGDFLYWYFDSFLLQLLKTTYYITESSAFRNQILYFRQDDWQTLCKPLIDRLASDTFEKIDASEAEEVLRQRSLGFSFVRLLPKETGVRPIVNLRRKALQKGSFGHQQSINQVLQATFQILSYEKDVQSALLGASVFGPNEIYTKIKQFKTRLRETSPNGILPKLYFVKMDVQACFDTIDQARLLGILRHIITENVYMMQRYGQVQSAAGKIKRSYIRKAMPEDDHPHFLSVARRLADAVRHTIFVDQVEYTFSEKDGIIKLLEEHITENIVKIGCDYYRQVVGIPQGSVLSTLLCSFFYGDLEQQKFKFSSDPRSVLLRLVDDYLFITSDLSKARNFIQMMNEGHPEYGCFISHEKTLINFDHESHIINSIEASQRGFPWCGYLINMKDLSLSVDYARYHETYLQDAITVDKARRPGTVFVQKMMQLAKHKSHIIFCDSDLNSEKTVCLNIYQNFLVTAMKMHHYVRSLGIDACRQSKFLHKSIQDMWQFTYATIRNRASSKIAKSNNGNCTIQKKAVVFFGMHAFHRVLSRKPEAYSALVKLLAFDLSLPQNRRLQGQYRTVLTEGQIVVNQLFF